MARSDDPTARLFTPAEWRCPQSCAGTRDELFDRLVTDLGTAAQQLAAVAP
jgi:hypothetical protein